MESESPKFDWIGWLASVPGIPSGWGETRPAAEPISMFEAPDDFGGPDMAGFPERKAA